MGILDPVSATLPRLVIGRPGRREHHSGWITGRHTIVSRSDPRVTPSNSVWDLPGNEWEIPLLGSFSEWFAFGN